jgi:hypothetical protein
MNDTKKYRDLDLRVLLMEHVARTYSGKEYFAALEARYAASDRRADVLVVSDYSHAFEIKSDVDRLDRLPGQLIDYRRTFDYLTVVTTQRHARKVKTMLGKKDGLIVICDHEIIEMKEPKRNKGIKKRNLAFMCSKPVLASALNVAHGSVSVDLIRGLAEKELPLAVLRQVVFSELKRKFKKKYDEFLEEACIPYREIDLTMLQSSSRLGTDLLLD